MRENAYGFGRLRPRRYRLASWQECQRHGLALSRGARGRSTEPPAEMQACGCGLVVYDREAAVGNVGMQQRVDCHEQRVHDKLNVRPEGAEFGSSASNGGDCRVLELSSKP